MNQPVRGRCVLSIIVPFVTENCLEHLVPCHLWAWPLTLEQVVQPHLGQRNPAGNISCRSLFSHASSSGYLLMRSASVPRASHSALLLPPACLFAISSLHRSHRSAACIMRPGHDRNMWGYALSSEPLDAKSGTSGTQAVHLPPDEPQLPYSRLRLGTCRHAELLHDMGDMGLHSRKLDVQDLADSDIREVCGMGRSTFSSAGVSGRSSFTGGCVNVG